MTKILTIDSEEAVVNRIVNILESNDYRAQSATTWTEAVDAVAHGQPDLVLLNLEMPIIPGDVLLEFIREEGFDMPVIVVSFPVEDAVAKVLREQGVYGIVEKPFEDKTLIKEIERVFEFDKAKSEEAAGSDAPADAEETEAAEKVSEESTEEVEETEAPPEEPTSEPTSDQEEEEESEPFLKQPRDHRASSRPKMSKRRKIIMFTVIGIYILFGGVIAAIYFIDEISVDQILSNW